MIFLLDKNNIGFPNPYLGEDDGLLAVGGDLSVERLLSAYGVGVFPWYSFKNEQILWWCPLDRFVIFPDEIHISHSLRQLIRKGTYRVTMNECFDEVINGCSKVDNRNQLDGAWLGEEMIMAYKALHDAGYAISVEVRDAAGSVVGGLYGVSIGSCFFGESMFSCVPNASKLALVYLADVMKPNGGMIDCQFETAHLKSMGGRHITYEQYMDILRMA